MAGVFFFTQRLASEMTSIHVAVISIKNCEWQIVVLAIDLYKSERISRNKAFFRDDTFCPKLFTFIFNTSQSSQTNPLHHPVHIPLQCLSLLQKKVAPYCRNINPVPPGWYSTPASRVRMKWFVPGMGHTYPGRNAVKGGCPQRIGWCTYIPFG